MRQKNKEYQNEYFKNEGYVLFDDMEAAVIVFCQKYKTSADVAKENIENDTNCDWIILNDGAVAVEKTVFEEQKRFNQIEYQNNYKREKYDKIEVIVPKGEKEHIKAAAKEAGLSVSAYIYKAVQETMNSGGTI